MGSVLGSIFGFGNKMKRRLRDAVSNPSDYAEMTADENRNEWRKNPDERSLGFFNPVPLGTMGNFAMRKELGDAVANLSRRDFLKKSAGLAGGTAAASIPGAKLLQKFAPEEKEIAAKAIPKEWASVEGGAHRYHSLKDYLDDVSTRAEGDILMSGNKWDDSLWQKDIRERLLMDEAAYTEAKRNLSSLNPKKDFNTGLPPQSQMDQLNLFSPQAKQEMKEFKSLTRQIDTDYSGSHDWTQWAVKNNEDPIKIIEELKRWYIP